MRSRLAGSTVRDGAHSDAGIPVIAVTFEDTCGNLIQLVQPPG